MKKIERLGEYISEYSVRNKDNEDIQVYSVTNTYGFCTEYFDKDVASKDQTNYKIVPKGYFAYNPSRINVGSIDCQSVEDRVIVSPLYVVFKADERVDNNYLLHYLKSDIGKTYINELASGSVRVNLKFSILQEISFPMIPIEEQKEKMAVIAKIDESIACCDSIIEKLDLAVKSRFAELFGDEKSFRVNAQNSVKDVGDVGVGIVIQPTQYYAETGVKAFRSLNVKPFRVNNSDWVYFSEDTNRMMERTQVHTNNIAVVRSGANLGDACVITDEYNGCNAIDILIIRINENIVLPEYLCAFINLPHGREQILRLQRGGALKHINVKELENSHLLVPPMDLQKRFADFINYTDKSKLAVQEMKNKMEILKASVMQEYFC